MKKSILSICLLVSVLFFILIYPQLSLAGPFYSDSPNLPPLDGRYISSPDWYGYWYASYIVPSVGTICIKDLILSEFTDTFPPPAPGMNATHSFGSRADMMLSIDNGTNWIPFWASANVTIYIASVPTDPNTYNIEMTQLGISGQSLLGLMKIRESPTKYSAGYTIIRPAGGGYQINSFFDIFTEVSLDGGISWHRDELAPIHIELGGICRHPFGDINRDNVVDWRDVGIMASQWLQSSGSADLDVSGTIDLVDYALLVGDWGAVGNCSPVVDAGVDQGIFGFFVDVSLAGTVSDDGKPTPPGTVTTTWSQVSGPAPVVFADASALNTTVALGNNFGTYVIRLTANDGELISYDEMTIGYSPFVPPELVVDAGADQSIELPADANVCGTATDEGPNPPPPGAITTQWTKLSGPNDVIFGDVNAVCTTASFGSSGKYVLRLTASYAGLSASDDVTITVAPQNSAPTVDAGIDQTVNVDNANLNGTVTDDGLPNPPAAVTMQWTKISGPNDVTFGDANAIDTTVTFGGYGMYVLRVTANDGEASAYDEVTITYEQYVPQNQAPVVDAGIDQQIIYSYPNVNKAKLDGTVTDDGLPNPPGDITTLWTVQSGPSGVVFDDANAVDANVTFPDAGGIFELRLTANDGELSSYDEVTITVIGKPGFSEAADYYVDGRTGSDTNPGTSDQPWATIQKAATTLNGTANKDKVIVWGNQTYTEQVAPSSNGTATYPNTYKRDPASGEAIINGNGNTNGTIYFNAKSYAVFDGFTITGAGDNGGVYIFQDGSDFITIKNCRIRGNAKHGIYVRDSDNTVINNCAIYSNNTGSGSVVYGVYVYNNVTATTITSCTINGNNYGGIYAVTSAVIGTIEDCIVTNNGTYGIRQGTGGSITSPKYCDVWNQTTNYSNVTGGTGCKSGDPGFTDPANGNFTPTSTTYAKPSSDGGWMGYRTSSSAL